MAPNASRPFSTRMLTPLWVLSLFVSLTETVLGVAVIQTSGGIQAALTGFVIIFPVLNAVGFFIVLWYKPHHMYAPAEYGQQVNVREYIDAITRRQPLDEDKLYSTIQETIRATLTSGETVAELLSMVPQTENRQIQEQIVRVLDSVVDKTVETIREEGFLTIDSTPMLGPEGRVWQVPYDTYPNVSALLDNIWFSLPEHSRPPSLNYGKLWTLRDSRTGRLFRELGSNWPPARGVNADTRSLREVGFAPGMRLEAIYL